MSDMIFICSPLRPVLPEKFNDAPEWLKEIVLDGIFKQNLKNTKEYCRKIALENNDNDNIPFAPHLYFTQFLNEFDETERRLGIHFGLYMLKKCKKVIVFGPRISSGMQLEIDLANGVGIPVEYRNMEKKDD